jgi:polyhydroxyalkanoate synthesis repressor PhaR
MRIIKRYTNRKLYDTTSKHYVTLKDLAVAIRGGDTINVTDHSTGQDLTSQTLTQILFEEEKSNPQMDPARLHLAIREGLK